MDDKLFFRYLTDFFQLHPGVFYVLHWYFAELQFIDMKQYMISKGFENFMIAFMQKNPTNDRARSLMIYAKKKKNFHPTVPVLMKSSK